MERGAHYFQHSFEELGVPGTTVSPVERLEDSTPIAVGRFVRELPAPFHVSHPAESADYLMRHVFSPFAAFEQEELWTLMLNMRHHVTHEAMIYRGSVSCTQVNAGEVFIPALRLHRPAVIVAHNHPSGDPTPSRDDIHLTKQLVAAAKILDLKMIDHIVIGDGAYFSLREKGLGFDGL